MRILNKDTIDLIKSYEGLRLNAYQDSVGVWTIGYGHTSAAGNPAVTSGMKITNQQAEDMLRSDLRKYQAYVEAVVRVPVNDNQYGAMVSLCYNIGPGNFAKSTLVKKVNASDWRGAAEQFGVWNKAGGKVLAGLVRRRSAEAALFAKPAGNTPSEPVQPVPVVPAPAQPVVGKPSEKPPVTLISIIIELVKTIFGRKS
jgi:lysozyme